MTAKIKYGTGLKMIGIFLLITGSLLTAGLSLSLTSPQLIPPGVAGDVIHLLFLLPIPMLVVGAFLLWRSRQYTAKTVAKRVISDSRPNVLYLRSFAADQSFSGYVILALSLKTVASGWETVEEQLGEVLEPFGDFVAIGKPGETLPTPGAARLYASDAEWKEDATDQMQTARLVVIRAGISGGLLWEVKEVVQLVNPKKLLIMIFGMSKKDYESFTRDAEQIFPITFPKADELKRFGAISGFFRFSPSWSPSFLPLRAPLLRCGYGQYRGLFKFTLRPVFEEYGLEWQPPPVTIVPLVVSTGIIVLIWLNIVMSYAKVFSWLLRMIKRLISNETFALDNITSF